MQKFNLGRLSALQFDNLSKHTCLCHMVTTREGWHSGSTPRFTGESPEQFYAFREELARSARIDSSRFYFPRQTHSDEVAVVNRNTNPETLKGIDALITHSRGVQLCIQTADCVPVLLFDPVRQVVAVVHAGWRGTVKKIVSKTVERMVEEFESRPEELLAGIGPSIHIHAYEVGEDVIQAVKESFTNHQAFLKPSMEAGKAYFDLWGATRYLLLEAGLQHENIELMGLCSFEHEDLFFSARREGAETGRMVSTIGLV